MDMRKLKRKLRAALNHQVKIVETDGSKQLGRLNYLGPSATQQGSWFIILDTGRTMTYHLEEIEDVEIAD